MGNYYKRLAFDILLTAVLTVTAYLAVLLFLYIAASNFSKSDVLFLIAGLIFASWIFFTRLTFFLSIVLIILCFTKKRKFALRFLLLWLTFIFTVVGMSSVYSTNNPLEKGAIRNAANLDTALIRNWAVEGFENSEFPENKLHLIIDDPYWAKELFILYLNVHNFEKYKAVELNYGNRAIGWYSYYIMIDETEFYTAFPHLIDYSHKISEGFYLVCRFGTLR